MLRIIVFGSGCEECQLVEGIVRKAVDDQAVEAEITIITDYDEIRKYPIMSTPALIINDRIVCDGRVPSQEEIDSWIRS